MSSPYITLSSRIAYQNRWLRIREDRIRHKDGSPGLYGVVERTDFVVIVPFRDGRVTLVEQYRYPVGERVWEFPMGSMPSPSADVMPETAAAAELREETGMVAERLDCIGTIFQGPGYCTQRGHIFLARGLREGEPDREASELDMICRWVSVPELETMIRDGTVCESMTLSAYSLLRLRGLL
ncbi:NUDIX hydrolase [Rhodopila sp.]|uniref:NUDIX hydrolase n=1 Tax=Rhodopila sp. TaxID=2480087 RepID=UPI002C09D4D2|nr:NUDIX hydrolase [Rhodopila sp.]HVZ07719.1 NUDIX hydrolase [Rhodopila sp.]